MASRSLFTVYLISLLLLILNDAMDRRAHPKMDYSQFHRQKVNHYSPFIQERYEIIKEKSGKTSADIMIALTTGQYQLFNREVTNRYKELALYHLFTPSGVHFSVLFATLFFCIRPLLRKRPILGILFELPILLLPFMPFFPGGLYPIIRVALYRLFDHLFTLMKLQITPMQKLYLVFFADYLMGNFFKCPLSFIYSFLFWGIVLAMGQKSSFKLVLAIFGGQLMANYFAFTNMKLLSPFFGHFITALFVPIIPLVFVTFLAAPYFSPLVLFTGFLINCVDRLTTFLTTVTYYSPNLPPSIFWVILTITLSLWGSMRTKLLLISLSITLFPTPLYNLPFKTVQTLSKQRSIVIRKEAVIDVIQRKPIQKGMTLVTPTRKCRVYPLDNFYSGSCKWERKKKS